MRNARGHKKCSPVSRPSEGKSLGRDAATALGLGRKPENEVKFRVVPRFSPLSAKQVGAFLLVIHRKIYYLEEYAHGYDNDSKDFGNARTS